jgi:hypothetical protein
MPTFNLTDDFETGKQYAVAKRGGRIPMDEFDRLCAEANAGDPASIIALRAFDYSVDDAGRELPPAHQLSALEASLHDCPECNAARARGETPRPLMFLDLLALAGAPIPGFRPAPTHPGRRKRRRGRKR